MERKLANLFDRQRFERNAKLSGVISDVESRYAGALADDDLEMVSAAGETGVPTVNPEVLLGWHALPRTDQRGRGGAAVPGGERTAREGRHDHDPDTGGGRLVIGAEAVYREFHPKVSAYVRGKVAHPQDAEEIVSAVFLKVVQKLDSYDPQKAALSTWVYTITRNTVTDYYRTRHTAAALEDWMAGEEPSPEMSDDALDGLADALMALKERERDLIVLHYYRGHTLKTVAQMMGMSYINAKVIHKKALAGLRLAMGA